MILGFSAAKAATTQTDTAETKAEAKPTPTSEPKPAAKAEPRPAPKAEVKPAPKPEAKAEPAPKPQAKAKAEEKPAEGAKDKEAGLPRVATEANGIVQLEPITTNLAFPTDRWIRLEVALMFKDAPDPKLAETIHQDIAVYIRTVSLQQIEGPRGFQYLKEDLEERADLISEGKVSRIMFRTFVIQ